MKRYLQKELFDSSRLTQFMKYTSHLISPPNNGGTTDQIFQSDTCICTCEKYLYYFYYSRLTQLRKYVGSHLISPPNNDGMTD